MDTDRKRKDIILYVCLLSFGFFLALLLKAVLIVDIEAVEITKLDGSIKVSCGSDSMGLTFGCGDLLYYRDVKRDEELLPGEIYVYRKDDETKVVHRLVECVDVDCELMVFKGDNNAVGELVEREQVTKKIESVRYR